MTSQASSYNVELTVSKKIDCMLVSDWDLKFPNLVDVSAVYLSLFADHMCLYPANEIQVAPSGSISERFEMARLVKS